MDKEGKPCVHWSDEKPASSRINGDCNFNEEDANGDYFDDDYEDETY